MINRAPSLLRGGLLVLRPIAVLSSSVATIVSTILPLYLYSSLALSNVTALLVVLIFGAIVIHGILTHVCNDYSDYLSGTDEHSPALLSGGSRVIQKGYLTPNALKHIGIWLASILLLIAIGCALFGLYEVAILLIVGVWGAVSYSLSPLRLSYRPFAGEWLSLFPSILLLGFAAPWIMLDNLPVWAVQNAVINALFCLAWVMVHHIPDQEADKQANPVKRTSVVWSANTFGKAYARLPAIIYLSMGAMCVLWLGSERLWAAVTVLFIISISILLVVKMDIGNHQQVTAFEKILLMLAIINAILLGIFI